MPSYYWTGLIKQGNLFYWPDGTTAGNGITSNADPVSGNASSIARWRSLYVHWTPAAAGSVLCSRDQFAPSGSCSLQYAHFAYNFQDRLSLASQASSPTYAFALASASWAYDSYTGNSSYLQMQSRTYYNSTASRNKYGWQAYPSSQRAPFICERPLAMYDCDLVNAPPRLPAAACMPTDNDTIVCPDTLDSCYFWTGSTGNNATATTKCAAMGGYPVAWNSADEQLLVETYFRVGATRALAAFRTVFLTCP